jgi:hypothetical protein
MSERSSSSSVAVDRAKLRRVLAVTPLQVVQPLLPLLSGATTRGPLAFAGTPTNLIS